MTDPDDRPSLWTWIVCGLLLLASTINYMDRQTLANTAKRVIAELEIGKEEYGGLEEGFGYAFAVGAIVFGFIADKVDVRWLYPCVLTGWSLAGLLTGYVESYSQLWWCRVILGFFESGHWPCALLTTQRLLAPRDRTFGNSVLQSGTSIGAIITPLIVLGMLTPETGSWRQPFIVIGAIGIVWVMLWLGLGLRSPAWGQVDHRALGRSDRDSAAPVDYSFIISRLLVLALVVVSINVSWQLLRAWLPLFLEEGRGYTESERLLITAVYNGFTDVGCILAGIGTVWLHRRGWGVQRSRVFVFTVCAAITALTIAIPWLPKGWPLLAVLFAVAAGSLGLFPCYYSFSQEISARHSGKVVGLLSTLAWLVSSPLQRAFGEFLDLNDNQYDIPMALVGTLPLAGALVLWIWWRETDVGGEPAGEAG